MDRRFKVDGCRLVVEMPREIDQHQAKPLCKELDFYIDSYGIRNLVFDFQKTEFMDSAGVGVIIGRSRNIGFFGGKTYAINLNDRIWKIFRASGLEKLVEIGGKSEDAN